jgi:hypothetical protein
MSLFRKIFSSNHPASNEDNEQSQFLPEVKVAVDEVFIYNFKKNGGKFIYCENNHEISEQFENILEENDWFENEVLCFDTNLFYLLNENKLPYEEPANPSFLLTSCENLLAEEGSVLFSSKQIKQLKPNDLPVNIVVIATTSQILSTKSDGLSAIKNKYERDYPTNITTIKYFEKAKEEDFTQYGSSPKNLYLLLLENL